MKVEKPFKKPDFEDLRKVLQREPGQTVVPIIELWVDAGIMSQASGIEFPFSTTQMVKLLNMDTEFSPEVISFAVQYAGMSVEFSKVVGYDYVIASVGAPIPRPQRHLRENPRQEGTVRAWREEHQGLITNRQEFGKFPWPSVDQINMIQIEYLSGLLPPEMKLLVFYPGVFEDLTSLMGFENMAVKSIEEPELLGDILEQLTVLAEASIDRAMAHAAAGAVFYGEDMGFKTATMLSPAFMKRWVLPCHKRIVDACHKHGKPFILHSCGQIDALMEDLIEVVGIDARHSFQDIIEPVEQLYRKYGDRIAILGGLDMDLLARGTADQVRVRTRQILEACAPGGNFAMGAGNSITDYCPLENYYAMLDELKRWNEKNG